MDKGNVAGEQPVQKELEGGKTYYWCACGKSDSQPFCDGSHKGTDFNPKPMSIPKTKSVFLCTCKQTDSPGFCDGSHQNL